MADETDLELDLEALERDLGSGEEPPERLIGPAAAPFRAARTGPELIEALPSSPGRPSESYEPDLPNWAVQGSNAKRLPGDGLACVSCPEAVWMTGGEDLENFCRVLRTITWSSREATPMRIEICTGKEMAIVALMDAQARDESPAVR